ncbi:MAG: SUMF1/EgtB/PvdO family nonheme iron enzyme [Gammaproteobacteria bacterium]|nr:SUMF1/EgtB/PvdO family nonheme iron enzyme [Gammaproteobacteria bacterium]
MNYQTATVDNISKALLDVRSRTLALVEGLNDEEMMGKVLPTVNPLKWEIAHAAYFHETWVLRHLGGQAAVNEKADELFDSINIQHEDRWDLPLPSLANTFEYMSSVLQYELELLRNIELDDYAKYFYLLALFHEDMHNEAFIYTRQTLSYPKPNFIKSRNYSSLQSDDTVNRNEDISIPGGSFMLGAERKNEFIFDNEKWAHAVKVAPFKIAKFAVSNEQYLEFVEDDGYKKEKYWSDEAWRWRKIKNLLHPVYWKKDSNDNWYVKTFDVWESLRPSHAVMHVSWYEAVAFCKWSNRRLPTEAEWEFAAASNPNVAKDNHYEKIINPDGIDANLDCTNLGTINVAAFPKSDNAFGCRQMFGNVWEWTSSTFKPYPGFSPDWYSEYSRPLFEQTKVLRGGAWTTRSRMLRNTLRNYYGPDRNDVFAGFRTCAIS